MEFTSLFAPKLKVDVSWEGTKWRQPLTLVSALRRLALAVTELAKATCGTIRLNLFKIGAVILRNTRRVRVHLSGAYPLQKLFALICWRLKALPRQCFGVKHPG